MADVADGSTFTVRELAVRYGVSERRVRAVAESLERRGQVWRHYETDKRAGYGERVHWRIHLRRAPSPEEQAEGRRQFQEVEAGMAAAMREHREAVADQLRAKIADMTAALADLES